MSMTAGGGATSLLGATPTQLEAVRLLRLTSTTTGMWSDGCAAFGRQPAAATEASSGAARAACALTPGPRRRMWSITDLISTSQRRHHWLKDMRPPPVPSCTAQRKPPRARRGSTSAGKSGAPTPEPGAAENGRASRCELRSPARTTSSPGRASLSSTASRSPACLARSSSSFSSSPAFRCAVTTRKGAGVASSGPARTPSPPQGGHVRCRSWSPSPQQAQCSGFAGSTRRRWMMAAMVPWAVR
mmetsp:Transcript_88987/g.252295  ORF Transcript_88987/g.252295 Transcript_88987/m.252295 type:complete len:244 (-) Transcript_88987:127-858(-)